MSSWCNMVTCKQTWCWRRVWESYILYGQQEVIWVTGQYLEHLCDLKAWLHSDMLPPKKPCFLIVTLSLRGIFFQTTPKLYARSGEEQSIFLSHSKDTHWATREILNTFIGSLECFISLWSLLLIILVKMNYWKVRVTRFFIILIILARYLHITNDICI